MSNTIPPLRQAPAAETTGRASLPAAGQIPAQAAPQAAAAQTDSVTLSAAAQSGAQLLGAAQNATGIDQTAVAGIRAQLAAGNYNVSPENLAQAIATVLKETRS